MKKKSAPRLSPALKTLVRLQISSGRVADGVDGESRRAFQAGRQGGWRTPQSRHRRGKIFPHYC